MKNDASEIPIIPAERLARWGVDESVLTLALPVQRPDVAVPVVELYLK